MYISDNESETRFLALFYIKTYNNESAFEWIYTIFQVLEIILIIFACLLNMYTVYMSFCAKTFHINLTVIYGVFMLHWFEIITSRIFVYPYQEAIFSSLTSTQKSESLILYAFDEKIVPVSNFESHLSLILGAGLRLRYMLFVCFALPCVAIERCFATWFVRDYELKTRPCISATLIIIAEVFATIGSWTATYQIVGVFFLAMMAAVLQLVSYIIIRITIQQTKYFEKLCVRNHNFYSLSVKFQLTENVHSFKVIHILCAEVGIMILTAATTILLADLDLISSSKAVFVFFILEKLIHVNPLFICVAVFWVKPHWVKKLIRMLPGRLSHHRTHALEYVEDHPSNSSSQADVHFEQLKKMW